MEITQNVGYFTRIGKYTYKFAWNNIFQFVLSRGIVGWKDDTIWKESLSKRGVSHLTQLSI